MRTEICAIPICVGLTNIKELTRLLRNPFALSWPGMTQDYASASESHVQWVLQRSWLNSSNSAKEFPNQLFLSKDNPGELHIFAKQKSNHETHISTQCYLCPFSAVWNQVNFTNLIFLSLIFWTVDGSFTCQPVSNPSHHIFSDRKLLSCTI